MEGFSELPKTDLSEDFEPSAEEFQGYRLTPRLNEAESIRSVPVEISHEGRTFVARVNFVAHEQLEPVRLLCEDRPGNIEDTNFFQSRAQEVLEKYIQHQRDRETKQHFE